MSGASKQQSRGFSIDYYQRLTDGGGWLDSLDISIQNWRHSISSFGGFDTAEFDLVEHPTMMHDWLNGLFRPIVVRDSSLDVMWEGFVNSVTINQGGLSVIHGPVNQIANRLFAIYSGVDTSVYPPQIGVRKKTPTINSLTSQQVWGVWHQVLSLAGVTDANADRLVDMYIQEHDHPDVSTNFSFGSDSLGITVQCLGWQHVLGYPYKDISVSGTIDLSERIKGVLTAQVNPGWISTDYSRIQPNTTQVKAYEEDDRAAVEHLRGLTAMGDAAHNRWMFGIYEGRQAVYEPVSTVIDYRMNLGDPALFIVDNNDAIVPTWKVRPGKWLFFQDFMAGMGVNATDFHRDPRFIMIESVQFDIRVPTEIQLTGGITSKYETQSAKLGLRGTDV